MTQSVEQLAARVQARFQGKIGQCVQCHGELTIEVLPAHLLDVCKTLRDDAEFSFEQLMDLCGVDYSAYGQADWQTEDASQAGFSRGVGHNQYREVQSDRPRYAVIYHLLSVTRNQRIRVRVYAPGEPPKVDSVVDIWNVANWFEREAFDLFGILFDGHPDLRRILTDYGFIGHPFRKDFPLEGNVEVRYDPEKGRVVYQPVTIENRVLVPRVIRHTPGSAQGGGNA
jgi:NADH-quinone oxidoreductase subunit C